MNFGYIVLLSTVLITTGLLAINLPRLSGHSKYLLVTVGYVFLVVSMLLSGLGAEGFGLAPATILPGTVVVLPALVIIWAVLGVVFLARPSVMHDQRYDQHPKALARYILATMPLTTVILEELLFRGVLLGMIGAYMTPIWAIIVSSLMFGLWHVFSAGKISISGARWIPRPLVVVGVVLATAAAGAVLAWIRLRTGSLLAPILVHWVLNASGAWYAFLSWRKS